MEQSLTFDDVLLLPGYSKILPKDVSLKTKLTKKISLNIPLISAAMDTVTEYETAVSMAQQGGIGIIHKNMSIAEQAAQVKKVKRKEFLIVTDPVTVSPDTTLAKLKELKIKKGVSTFPVLKNNKVVGIITSRDVEFVSDLNKKVKNFMTKKVVSVKSKISTKKAKQLLQKHKIEKLLIIDSKKRLKGLITASDIEKTEMFPDAAKDSKGRLLVGAAVGPMDDERAKALVAADADVIVIDTAHGHSKNVISAVKRFKKKFKVQIIAGNVATGQGAKALMKAGADAVKIGVGPGAICTTRIISGVGVPQISAIKECVKAVKGKIPVIADGGIKYSGDITKALATGANSVMTGSLFAGCDETPGEIIYMNNRKFKQYRGMGSISAMKKGSKDRYGQKHVIEEKKLVPEGIEGTVPYKGKISEIIFQMLGGLRAGMGMTGSENIEQLRKKTKMVQITQASLQESHPHSVQITSQSPNYP